MATTTRNRNTRTDTPARDSHGRFKHKSAFSFGGQGGALAAAAVAGAAVGYAANMGRKMMMQSPTYMAGNWDEALKAEHKATLALFDQLEATSDDQTTSRSHLVMKLKYALSKHALQEEDVIYPAMREANEAHDADDLNGEHGYVKTYLYELENMAKDSPQFLARVRDFRTLLEGHIRNEEDNVFPRLRAALSEEQNKKLTMAMNREGLKLA
ncbi:MAG TPA: hemerythrin domain-containing protein [Allosphingosinicella sp.]